MFCFFIIKQTDTYEIESFEKFDCKYMIVSRKFLNNGCYYSQSNMILSWKYGNMNFSDDTSKPHTIIIIEFFCDFFSSMHTTSLVLLHIRNSVQKVSFSRF